jgi:hypothetical protein
VLRSNKYLKHSNTCFEIWAPKNGNLIQKALRKKICYISLAAGKMTRVCCNYSFYVKNSQMKVVYKGVRK